MSDLVKRIKSGRLDLTDYVIHFTRSIDNLSPFDVVKSIVRDGYIKAGWSIRGSAGRKTVLGPTPAVCFTETPLYGFLNYVSKRDRGSVAPYGIVLKKADLFKAGGRSAIYGCSLDNNIVQYGEDFFVSSLPVVEQYRYILTDIDSLNDWTHEREWRWANLEKNTPLEGLPLWKVGSYGSVGDVNTEFQFSRIGILVQKEREEKEIVGMLISCFDEAVRKNRTLKQHEWPEFYTSAIQNTFIINLSKVNTVSNSTIRLEDLLSTGLFTSIGKILREQGKFED